MKASSQQWCRRRCIDGIATTALASTALASTALASRRWHRSIDDGAIEGEGRLVEDGATATTNNNATALAEFDGGDDDILKE